LRNNARQLAHNWRTALPDAPRRRYPLLVVSSSAPQLELVLFSQDDIQVVPVPAGASLKVGRAEDNDVCVENPSLSRYHAVLHAGPPLRIEDLGGTNGTFVPEEGGSGPADTVGLRQLSRQAAEIAVGQAVMLGGVTIVVRRARQDPTALRGADANPESRRGVIHDPGMAAAYDQAELAAGAAISVLLLGETGVGKEVLARFIHERSARKDEAFAGVNCAALSGSLLEAALFGYEKGAFTGASQAHPGVFEAADRGTLFLDEVGELPGETQAKLLRIIEERQVTRLGGRSARKVDVRFIAATNRDVQAEVRASRFRADLFYRLNGMSILIPPLRERQPDIEPLACLFAAEAARQLDKPAAPHFSNDALEALTAYDWPGNVRELRNAIDRALVLCRGDEIRAEHLPGAVRSGCRKALDADPKPIQAELKELEKKRIVEALRECGGNQSAAAKLLGMSRRTFVARLVEFNLPRPRKLDPSSE